jgi:DNA-binding NtrC family response regulator
MHLFSRLKGLNTLLIDDDEVIRETMKMVFAYNGCLIKVVGTAEDGLGALARETFDIIICDFRLPGINGVEFFRQAIESYPHTVRVLISGYGNEETIREAFEVGVHEFMKKPFSLVAFLERLIPHVDKHLAEKRNHHKPTLKKAGFKNKTPTKPPKIEEVQSAYWPKKVLVPIW